MSRPRVYYTPDPDEWITLYRAAELTGYAYSYLRKLVRLENAPSAIVHGSRLYISKTEALAKWGGAYASPEEAISSQQARRA